MLQGEPSHDRRGPEIEVLRNAPLQLCVVDLAGTEGLDPNADRPGVADRVAELQLALSPAATTCLAA